MFSQCGTTMIQQGAIIDGDVCGACGVPFTPSHSCQVTWLKGTGMKIFQPVVNFVVPW
jgi:hypothetical protein